MSNTRSPAALALDGLSADARAAFDLAADAGYSAVAFATNHTELAPAKLSETGRRHVRKILASRQLSAASLRVAGPRGGLNDAKAVDRIMDNARAAIALAHDLGVATISVNAGPADKDGHHSPTAEAAAREIANLADRAGLTVAFSAEDDPLKLKALLDALAFDRARMNLDSLALIAAHTSPDDVASTLGKYIGQFTAADAIKAGRETRIVELGEGQLPLKDLLEALREADFSGPTVVRVDATRDPAAAARHAAAVMRKLLAR